MVKQYPEFISNLEKSDPELHAIAAKLYDSAMEPGELDAKTKLLIALSIDAFAGSSEGVRSLSKAAKNIGITDGQIKETLRIAYMISGNRTLSSINSAFEG